MKWTNLEENVSLRMLCTAKPLPPGIVHPVTKQSSILIKSAEASHLASATSDQDKDAPSRLSLVNILNAVEDGHVRKLCCFREMQPLLLEDLDNHK